MAYALASLIEIKNREITGHEFHLPLCDVLLDLVKQDIDGPHALKFSEIAHSLAHDVLNLAVLAGRLLWCEGVSPNMTRSPDLVAIAVDTENYFVLLRTAYDIITKAVVHFGVEARNRGKTPSESFNSLKNWIENKKYPDRINKFHKTFRFIVDYFDRFEKLKDLRDRIVHQGHRPIIYTDRIRLEFFLAPTGIVELQWLHGGYKQEDHREDKPRFKRVLLLSFLREHTTSILELTNQLCRAIEKQHGIRRSGNHALSGAYVPALHHLLAYKEPPERNDLNPNQPERLRRGIAAFFLLKAGDYLSAIERGYPDRFWWRFAIRLCEMFTDPPTYMSRPKFANWGVVVGWDIVFHENGKNVALSLRDNILLETKWLMGMNENLDTLSKETEAHRIVLVAKEKKCPTNGPVAEDPSGRFLVETDPIVAAEKAYQMLNQPNVDQT
jgi:hypothetical protein